MDVGKREKNYMRDRRRKEKIGKSEDAKREMRREREKHVDAGKE